MRLQVCAALVLAVLLPNVVQAQTNPLWRDEKVKNYLPHMTWPEVQALLTRTDIAIIPVPSMEQHGPHLPIGTDALAGIEQAKLIAQRTDVLVVPVLLAGQAGYHMEFPGTITLSSETIQQVYFETAQSLIHHGFRRFLLLNSHAGNQNITRFVIDRINQGTPGIAVDLGEAAATMPAQAAPGGTATGFDRHAGVGETSTGLYLFPSLVRLDEARKITLTLPPHLSAMLPQVVAGDPAATLVFLAEGLKPRDSGKKTSTREMSSTGAWSERDPREATAEQGRRSTESLVDRAVRFIDRWKALRPMQR